MKNKIICLIISFFFVFTIILLSPKREALALDGDIDYSVVNPDNTTKEYVSNMPEEWYDFDEKFGALLDENGNIPEGGTGTSTSAAMAFVDLIDSSGKINYANDSFINLAYNQEVTFYIEAGYLNWGQGIPYFSCSFDYHHTDLEISVSQKYGDELREGLFTEEGVFNSYDSMDDWNNLYPILREGNIGNNVYRNEDFHLFAVTIKAKEIRSVSNLSIFVSNGKGGGCNKTIDLTIAVSETPIEIDYISAEFTTQDESKYEYDLESGVVAIPYSKGKMLGCYELDNIVLNSRTDYGNGGTFSNNIVSTLTYSGGNANCLVNNLAIRFSKPGKYNLKAIKTIEFYYVLVEKSYLDGTLQYSQEVRTIVKEYEMEFFIYDESSFTFTDIEGKDVLNSAYYLGSDKPGYQENYSFAVKEANYFGGYKNEYVKFLVDGANHEGGASDFFGTLSLGRHYLSAEITDKYTGVKTVVNPILINIGTAAEIYPEIEFSNGNSGTIALDELGGEDIIALTSILKYDAISSNGTVSLNVVGDNRDSIFLETGSIFLIPYNVGVSKITVSATYKNGTKKENTFVLQVVSTITKYTVSQTDIELNLTDKTSTSIEFGFMNDDLFTKISSEGFYFQFNTPNALVYFEQSMDDYGTITIETNNKTGSEICTILVYKDELIAGIVNVSVLVSDGDKKVTETTFNFVEGTKANMIMNNVGLVLNIDPLVSTLNLQFVWYSLNTKVATVKKINQTSAEVTAVGSGSTQIVAIYSDSTGSTITGIIDVYVIESIPTIGVNVGKENDSSAFTIYDCLSISLNKKNFNFSSLTTYEWFLDGEELTLGLDSRENVVAIDDKTTAFYLKLTEGLHTVKVVLNDSANGFVIEGEQAISITTIINQERVIGVDCQDVIYMAYNGGRFKINALIDGVVNNDYDFSFSIDDLNVVSIFMSAENSVLIEPRNCGETTMNVFTDIGKFESKIIRKEIKIIVEEITDIKIVSDKEFYKPGADARFEIIYNGKSGFVNVDPEITFKINDEDISYEKKGNIIEVHSLASGKLELSAAFQNRNFDNKYNVTNFNVKQFILTILPYLCGAAFLAIVIYTIYRLKGDPYKSVQIAVAKTKKCYEKEKEKIKAKNNYKAVKAAYVRLERRTNTLLNKVTYYYDEGIYEYEHTISNITSLKKILIALIKTVNEKTNVGKALDILENINNKQINNIDEMINEIIVSHKQYDANVKKAMSKEEMKEVNDNKKKMSKEQYKKYLEEIGFAMTEGKNDEEGEG